MCLCSWDSATLLEGPKREGGWSLGLQPSKRLGQDLGGEEFARWGGVGAGLQAGAQPRGGSLGPKTRELVREASEVGAASVALILSSWEAAKGPCSKVT